MPWKSVSAMDQRRDFLAFARQGGVGMSELCRRFGISRDTGYRLLRRFEAEGEAGLADRSRRPLSSPSRTDAALEVRVLELRDRHPAWGGRKIARRLADLGVTGVPAPSTVTEILRRHGRLDPAEADRHRAFTRFERASPNDLWQMDFKGHFGLDCGRCHPLTVLDDHSRYSLGLEACADETRRTVQARLTALFRRHGLPQRMLADNGAPWGTTGSGSAYSALGVWLMRLGIGLMHGRPRHPQTQGKDERFHRTLAVELLQWRRFRDLADCQSAFDAWRDIYNHERPHQALDLATPACRYRPSPRHFPETLPEPEYGHGDAVRKVGPDGYFRFKGRTLKISQAFSGMPVALRPTTIDGVWNVAFASFIVAQVDLRDNEASDQPVRHVSEHLSDMSPV